MESNSSYIKTDNNIFINEKCIVWVRKMDNCLKVGTVQSDVIFTPFLI